ncbi:SRPBCC family protein, partial [Roseibium album]
MDISGSQLIPASREEVWRALNDPEVLKACIPGCESLEKTSETEMNAAVTTKIGPVKAKFKGAVTLEDLNPP